MNNSLKANRPGQPSSVVTPPVAACTNTALLEHCPPLKRPSNHHSAFGSFIFSNLKHSNSHFKQPISAVTPPQSQRHAMLQWGLPYACSWERNYRMWHLALSGTHETSSSVGNDHIQPVTDLHLPTHTCTHTCTKQNSVTHSY